ncbi:hypothetical protein LCGC14_0544320 [marine sediment metagenome]|uniref:Uncharacterized protein n=1 Tax=marine sediment metagenome TaxID=412755 RepID=A0A0F9RRU9_9ZZZZ
MFQGFFSFIFRSNAKQEDKSFTNGFCLISSVAMLDLKPILSYGFIPNSLNIFSSLLYNSNNIFFFVVSLGKLLNSPRGIFSIALVACFIILKVLLPNDTSSF